MYNVNSLDPITGFDFELSYYDPIQNDLVVFGKFQEMDLTFDGFDTFNWSLKRGLVNIPLFNNLFKINLTQGLFTDIKAQPGFNIIYPEIKDGNHISNLYLGKSVMSSITTGIMPGNRIPIIEASGSSYAFSKETL